MNRFCWIRRLGTSFAVVIATVTFAEALRGGVVNYSGYVTHYHGNPVSGGLVVLGAFAPDFDVSTYSCTYALDENCNLDYGNAYTDAVADGNFIPIDSTLTEPDGTFSGSGFTSLPEGTQLSIFAFEYHLPTTFFQAIVGGSDPSWFVSAAGNNILVGEVQLSVVPFPEPASIAMGAIALCGLIGRRPCSTVRR